jgi:acyl-coenzyme A thioesterase PaaI-like protein
MAKADPGQYTYVLPFRRFNKNWYNAMAGAALVGNSEVAAGMYIFKHVGNHYTVVCKELHYRFLRPCFGPAVYRVIPNAELSSMASEGKEFNVPLTINIYQPPSKPSEVEKRVGRCKATFHVTPKVHHKARKAAGRKPQVK